MFPCSRRTVIGCPLGWVHSTWRSRPPPTSSMPNSASAGILWRWVSITRQEAHMATSTPMPYTPRIGAKPPSGATLCA
jgi:hypothetical protein